LESVLGSHPHEFESRILRPAFTGLYTKVPTGSPAGTFVVARNCPRRSRHVVGTCSSGLQLAFPSEVKATWPRKKPYDHPHDGAFESHPAADRHMRQERDSVFARSNAIRVTCPRLTTAAATPASRTPDKAHTELHETSCATAVRAVEPVALFTTAHAEPDPLRPQRLTPPSPGETATGSGRPSEPSAPRLHPSRSARESHSCRRPGHHQPSAAGHAPHIVAPPNIVHSMELNPGRNPRTAPATAHDFRGQDAATPEENNARYFHSHH
jgi:hypothetical protein